MQGAKGCGGVWRERVRTDAAAAASSCPRRCANLPPPSCPRRRLFTHGRNGALGGSAPGRSGRARAAHLDKLLNIRVDQGPRLRGVRRVESNHELVIAALDQNNSVDAAQRQLLADGQLLAYPRHEDVPPVSIGAVAETDDLAVVPHALPPAPLDHD
eukprot:scaffold5584_cov110-Isochrysis_galbana.AAC.11